ncbi:uncharacterized protein METZ01_LOCUS197737, partial [marine metagenome]
MNKNISQTLKLMKVALKEANKAAKRDEVPVGAVLTDQSGKIL